MESCASVKKDNICKDYMKRVMNEENDFFIRDHKRE